jgi:DeoR/GlpR family transcriptional regulator of sugar metabolism
VINTFICCGTTCEALVHVLGRETPRTTRELLDVAT